MAEKSQKRRGPALWLAERVKRRPIVWGLVATIVFPTTYMGTFGGLLWLDAGGLIPDSAGPWLRPVVFCIYGPVIMLGEYGPDSIREPLEWYVRFCQSL